MKNIGIVQFVYSLFVGVLLALFVGVGVNTFYPGPTAPQDFASYGKELTSEQIEQQKAFDKKVAEHNKAMKPYNRNVSILTLLAAVAFLIISVIYEKYMHVLSDGVMLGGLFTLFYSIGRGFASESSRYEFTLITISLVAVLYLGYDRFVKDQLQPVHSKK